MTAFEEAKDALSRIHGRTVSDGELVALYIANLDTGVRMMEDAKNIIEWETGVNIWYGAKLGLLSYKFRI